MRVFAFAKRKAIGDQKAGSYFLQKAGELMHSPKARAYGAVVAVGIFCAHQAIGANLCGFDISHANYLDGKISHMQMYLEYSNLFLKITKESLVRPELVFIGIQNYLHIKGQ